MDRTFISGGKVKTVVGGIIVCFFIMVTLIVAGGFIINYSAYNAQVTTSETKNPFMNRSLPSSYLFNVTIFTSRFIDSQEPFQMDMDNYRNIKDKPMPDLCKNRIEFFTDRYFSQVKAQNFNCERRQLSNGTDEYNLSLLIKNIDDGSPENAYVRFLIKSDYDQVFHFFKWEYWNIWKFFQPVSYTHLPKTPKPQNPMRITLQFK